MAPLRSETASLGRAGEGIRVMRMLWPHEPPAKGVTVMAASGAPDACVDAAEQAFGADVDCEQVVKLRLRRDPR